MTIRDIPGKAIKSPNRQVQARYCQGNLLHRTQLHQVPAGAPPGMVSDWFSDMAFDSRDSLADAPSSPETGSGLAVRVRSASIRRACSSSIWTASPRFAASCMRSFSGSGSFSASR